ncbi:hypothetical protein KIN20_010057 [Parelaphostrongylus tenuis]|uniref:Uncharacterized protein n=1 Tax=Parelaphostrongylus tenuis TaxID=148309 RepID=A0AAD5M7B2_PARTN|nr:hypothetical protein KIN20_010057 [Parelaphostrongylus tenuis]
MQTKQDFFYCTFPFVKSTPLWNAWKLNSVSSQFASAFKRWQLLSEPNAQELSTGEEQIRRHQSSAYSKALVCPVILDAENSER